jgi:hypothetical protein
MIQHSQCAVGERKILITFPYHHLIKYSISVPLIIKSYLGFLVLVLPS